ncbi:MAG: methyltransferase domain-containing protein [Erysipelotrichaceae bacterium]|nr:methyltransferase domain-containing protein [Erysipelotrichaceae bacterium]
MIYQTLAPFYDSLVKDEEATQDWVTFTQMHGYGQKVLELACGSGEITIALAKKGYQMHATDLSSDMIEQAKKKTDAKLVQWDVLNMLNLSEKQEYDMVLCYCDSLNYLMEPQDVKQVFKRVYDSLKDQGVFLFDAHSLDRETEFDEEYIEEGFLDDVAYQWTIRHEDHLLYHSFAFYDQKGNLQQEQHIQRVYDPNWLIQELQIVGFQCEVYTDFTLTGIQEGEKIFFVAKKGERV